METAAGVQRREVTVQRAGAGAVGGAGVSYGAAMRNTPIATALRGLIGRPSRMIRAWGPCFFPENREIFQEKQGGD